LMAIIIMYFLFIISLSTACFFLYIISRMCLSFLFTLPLWLKINFLKKIKKIYSDNCGEFIKLRPIVVARGISHFTITP
jgi:hypothetical protein